MTIPKSPKIKEIPFVDNKGRKPQEDFYRTQLGNLAFVLHSERGWRYRTATSIEQELSSVSFNGFERIEDLSKYRERLEQELALIKKYAQTQTKCKEPKRIPQEGYRDERPTPLEIDREVDEFLEEKFKES